MIKKLGKAIMWTVFNGAWLGIIYGAFVLGSPEWLAVFKFFFWFYCIIHCIGLLAVDDIVTKAKEPYFMPLSIPFAFDLIVTGMIVYYSTVFYATMYLIASCIQVYMLSEVNKKFEDKK